MNKVSAGEISKASNFFNATLRARSEISPSSFGSHSTACLKIMWTSSNKAFMLINENRKNSRNIFLIISRLFIKELMDCHYEDKSLGPFDVWDWDSASDSSSPRPC